MKETYSIQDIANMTMLTERTIRSYLRQGFLRGEKLEGEWRFSEEEINNFLEQDTVKHSIAAKRNGILYSFLAEDDKKTASTCQIFDFPVEEGEGEAINQGFCNLINTGHYENLRYSYEYHGKKKQVRVILSGALSEILAVSAGYFANPV